MNLPHLLKRKTFNDSLAILLIVGLPAMWVADAYYKLGLSGEVTGATIAAFTLVVQHFFRKAAPNGGPPTAPKP